MKQSAFAIKIDEKAPQNLWKLNKQTSDFTGNAFFKPIYSKQNYYHYLLAGQNIYLPSALQMEK